VRLTGSQSVSLGVEPHLGLIARYYYCLTVTVLVFWGTLSDERTGLSLYVLLALASAVFLRSKSLGTCDHILLSHIWDFPFHRLLRLSGSRWRYSTRPLHVERRTTNKHVNMRVAIHIPQIADQAGWCFLVGSLKLIRTKSHCGWRSVSH
jgi:hypothetical protein